LKTLEYKNNTLILIDQTKLPLEENYILCKNYIDVGEAIKNMIVRGAPAIGVTASYGLAIGANKIKKNDFESFMNEFNKICDYMKSTRPTAVNLFTSIDRILNIVELNKSKSVNEIKLLIEAEAIKLENEDVETNKLIGKFGNELIKDNTTILTHCNAGALATCDYGTALGVIRYAHENNKKINVFADETRPYLQGARLTSFELKKAGIPVTVICDNMAGYFMNLNKIDCVIVGADRIALNGDTANKIGTYSLSVLAKEHNIPFYVAAPITTIDFSIDSGSKIPIEERDKSEVSHFMNIQICPDDISIRNPSFDITPEKNITAIITDKGIIKKPFYKNLKSLKY
jgi:methylthioribose-1-phosphate isomerase